MTINQNLQLLIKQERILGIVLSILSKVRMYMNKLIYFNIKYV